MVKFQDRFPDADLMRLLKRVALIASACLGVAAPSAMADTAQSSNWAGYAVHRAGVRFTKVFAAWRQPSATCVRGQRSFSAVWVGLGGYNESSDALEQIGSEIDCTSSGSVSSSVWYELVPAASQSIHMRVRPGDALTASVTVVGHRVTVGLSDNTTHRTFRRTLHPSAVDTSSAEWIVEAPSECVSDNSCQTLPLANFGTTTISQAAAQTVGRHSGSISDPAWDTTKIRLTPGARRLVNLGSDTTSVATPSALTNNGSSFKVTFSTVNVTSNPFLRARQAAATDGYLVHPGR
jgi:Peptidase A4 family